MKKLILLSALVFVSCKPMETKTYYPSEITYNKAGDSIKILEYNRNGTVRHNKWIAVKDYKIILKK